MHSLNNTAFCSCKIDRGPALLQVFFIKSELQLFILPYFRQMESVITLLEKRNNLKLHKDNFKPTPLFSLISQLLASLREFCRSDLKASWIEYLYKTKKPNCFSQLLRKSWQIHRSQSLECQLLSSLLQQEDRRKLQLYLRLRKYISQLTSSEQLGNTILKYEDSITIIHRMFPAAIRKQISVGMKQIFIAYKVADAKIYACVLIEFILSIYDSNEEEQQSLMAGQTKSIQQIQLSNFSTISKFNSNLHKNSRPYRGRRNNEANYQIIQAKFIPTEPQESEGKVNYFNEEEGHEHYYYSNSLSYEQQNSQSNEKQRAKLTENKDENCNKENWLSNLKSNQSLSLKRQKLEPSREILIQESHNASSSVIIQENMPVELREMAIRNREFKKRMLSLKQEEGELSNAQQMGLRKTINIIHSSVVRNLPYK